MLYEAAPTRKQIRDLAHRYRMRVQDVRRGLFKEKDGEPIWGDPPPPWEAR